MNIGTVRRTIALCRSLSSCTCFDRLFNVQPFYNADNELEYIQQNKKVLTIFLSELLKHQNKDVVYQQFQYQSITADSLKQAFDHHLETLYRFQRYILKSVSQDYITFNQNNGDIDIAYYIDTILKLTTAYECTNRIFHQPNTPIPTKRLMNEIDLHLHNIQLFEDFYFFQTLSKQPIKKQYGISMFKRHRNLSSSKTNWTYHKDINESGEHPRFC